MPDERITVMRPLPPTPARSLTRFEAGEGAVLTGFEVAAGAVLMLLSLVFLAEVALFFGQRA